MNEETKQFITKHFESNFLDGDVMPCKAVTFTAYGALDVAEYFYELAVEAERERIVEEVKKLNSGKGGGNQESFDADFIQAQKKVINLIQNK